jgi:hypothetical protein
VTLFDLIVKFGIYGKNELQKELKVRDDIAAKLADTSEAGLIPRFIKAVNGEQSVEANEMVEGETQLSYTPSENETTFVKGKVCIFTIS